MYKLERTQRLPISLDEAWDFFACPDNLQKITPAYMGFDIKSGGGIPMYAGMIIRYTVRPLWSIPMTWVTEITHVVPGQFFVDEQRVGPYAIWHHQHHFKAIENGVEMTDILHYKLPLGLLGKLAYPFLVKNKLEEIFNYRNQKMIELFGTYSR